MQITKDNYSQYANMVQQMFGNKKNSSDPLAQCDYGTACNESQRQGGNRDVPYGKFRIRGVQLFCGRNSSENARTAAGGVRKAGASAGKIYCLPN